MMRFGHRLSLLVMCRSPRLAHVRAVARFSSSLYPLAGRKNTYHLYFGLGIPLYLSIPVAAEWVGTSPGMAPLMMFCSSTMLIFTMSVVWRVEGTLGALLLHAVDARV